MIFYFLENLSDAHSLLFQPYPTTSSKWKIGVGLGLLGNSSTVSELASPGELSRLGLRYFVSLDFSPFHLCVFVFFVCFTVSFHFYCFHARCLGNHSCFSSSFSMTILNRTCIFRRSLAYRKQFITIIRFR